MIRSNPLSILFAALVVSATTLPDNAAVAITASDYTGGGTITNFFNATGWWFTPTTNITVTHLGLYDHGSSGFADPHEVGIFLGNGTPVVTTSLAAGLSGTFVPGTVNGSRVVPIAPTVLQAGTQYYTVADNFSTDTYAFGTASVTHAPELIWQGFGDGATNSIFSTVMNLGGLPGNTGPNFLYFVPEPATATMLLIVGITLAVCRHRRK